ncbi:unnamed protein product [Cochlearia groenlandica]
MESHVDDDDDEIKSVDVSLQEETENEDSIKTLTQKLSAALANVSAKDELVNQHAKVAEEAVAGWEKAESEAVELKEKLESFDDKNRVLEDRVSHLDGALKECVRQLRQARDEQEERVQDAVAERTQELQSSKTSLENQILESASKTKDLSEMAESVAKENVMLRHELLARCEELEIRTIERDLSTQAAETASKQQLDIIKKVAKLEAECRKLRVLAKSSSAASFSDHRSTDSHSDGGERVDMSCSDSWTSTTLVDKRSLHGASSSVEIDLMGDFLEMERLVALPETPDRNGKSGPESVIEDGVVHAENSLVVEVEVLACRNKELEQKLEKLEAVKDELESQVKCNKEVESTLRFELEAMVCNKMELEEKLEKLIAEKDELESEVKCNREVKNTLRLELEAMCYDKMELAEKLEKSVAEKDELESKVKCNREVENRLRLELEAMGCDKMELENKLEKLVAKKDELESEVKCNREVENKLRSKLEAMVSDKMELENKLEVEKAELHISFDIVKDKYKESQVCLQDIETKLDETQKEMNLTKELKAEVESRIIAMEAESQTKSVKIESLEEDMRKEKLASDELRRKCETLEEEVSLYQDNIIKRDNTEPKIKQEDMVKAAEKLENCRKTIASLEKQLQSLATLEDFLVDTTSIPVATNGVISNNNNNGRNHLESIRPTTETSLSSVSSKRGSSEKNRNGFAKVFTRSKDGIHLAI